MSAFESKKVVDRVAAIREGLGAEQFGEYAFLVLGTLAYQAPEVVTFILDNTASAVEGVS